MVSIVGGRASPEKDATAAVSQLKRKVKSDASEAGPASKKACPTSVTPRNNGKQASVDSSANSIFKKFVVNALDEKALGKSARYEELRNKFRSDPSEESAPSSRELQMTLLALSNTVSTLNHNYSTLVKDVVECQWIGRDTPFVSVYSRFLSNLVSAHSNYMGIVTRMLVGYLGFLPNSVRKLPHHNPVTREVVYERAHYALQSILELVPTAAYSTLFPALVAEYPHKGEKKAAHISYLTNLLRVVDYAPALRNSVLSMVTDRVIKIDIEIQIDLDDLEDEESEELEMELLAAKDTAADVSENEGPDAEDSGGDGASEYDEEEDEDTVKNIRDTVDKLDTMLDTLFEYYARSFPPKVVETPSVPSIDIFELVLMFFDTTILPTYRSRYTQFLVFWVAQRSPQFSDQFCVSVLDKALDNSRPQGARQVAASYIASFVARAKFMTANKVASVVRIMCRWLSEFVECRSTECNGPDVAKWGGFYSVCQAVMYIFCFRWKDLKQIDEDDFGVVEESWVDGLEVMQKVITSRFNPLKVCNPTIVENFAKISNHLQLLYCFTIIEQNKRTGLSSRGSGEVECYFPFDPYKLKRSKRWIEDCYNEWAAIEGLEEEEEDSETDDSEESGSEDGEEESVVTDDSSVST